MSEYKSNRPEQCQKAVDRFEKPITATEAVDRLDKQGEEINQKMSEDIIKNVYRSVAVFDKSLDLLADSIIKSRVSFSESDKLAGDVHVLVSPRLRMHIEKALEKKS